MTVVVGNDALLKVLAFVVKAAETLAADQHPTVGPTAEDWAAINSVQKAVCEQTKPALEVVKVEWDSTLNAPIFVLSDGTVRKPGYSANGYGWDLGWK
ncbi:hypothetical protein KBA63_01670 [Candidatus Woesebacteria bacterium]|nr:hypothetical protein [Candidatus Woesebacteria bacterium]